MPILHDDQGRIRTYRTLGLISVLVLFMGLATSLILLAATSISPAVLAFGTLAILVLVKVPLLAVVWWLMGKHMEKPGRPAWDADERREILDYLEREAARVANLPDAGERLAFLRQEAWRVADGAPPEDKAAAAATALRIGAIAAHRQPH